MDVQGCSILLQATNSSSLQWPAALIFTSVSAVTAVLANHGGTVCVPTYDGDPCRASSLFVQGLSHFLMLFLLKQTALAPQPVHVRMSGMCECML